MSDLPSPTPDPNEGEARKRDALRRLEVHREVYVQRGRRALLLRLLDAGTATADDVRAAVELPAGLDPKLFGAVPGPLAVAGIIKAAGFVKTRRKAGHARPVQLWKLANHDSAISWLALHPADHQQTLFD